MITIRLRSQISSEELDQKWGKILSDDDYNCLLTGPAKVQMPDGKPLLTYLPRILDQELLESSYEVLHSLKNYETNNRGLASGSKRARLYGGVRTYSKPVASAIIGSFEKKAPFTYCRLTAWTGREMEKYSSLFPLFRAIAGQFKAQVPDRFENQMEQVGKTPADWVIRGTPFSTITVNNTYPTGVHTDKGDLDQGYSCLATLRKGDYTGGRLVFPEFRVAVDMQHGDLLLMDAHQAHGNTALSLDSEDAERISVVCYYRTKIATCDSMAAENQKAARQPQSVAV